jgi:hypothetical protein
MGLLADGALATCKAHELPDQVHADALLARQCLQHSASGCLLQHLQDSNNRCHCCCCYCDCCGGGWLSVLHSTMPLLAESAGLARPRGQALGAC